MRFKLSVLILIILIGLSGCGNESGDDENTTELEGAWKIGCSYQPNDDNYDIEKISVTGYLSSGKISTYSDASCSLPIFSVEAKGSVLIGNSLIITTGQTVKELTYSYTEWFVTPGSAEIATAYNTDSRCGNSSWSSGVRFDVTNCVEFDPPKVNYDIFKIDGNNLFLGDNDFGDGSTSSNRPTQLEIKFYTRQ